MPLNNLKTHTIKRYNIMVKSTPVSVSESQTEQITSTAPVKTKKSKKTSSGEEVPSLPVDEVTKPVSSDAEVVQPVVKSSKKKGSKVVDADLQTPVQTDSVENVVTTQVAPPSEDVLVPESPEDSGETAVIDLFSQFTSKLASIHTTIGGLKSELKVIEKKYHKDLKALQKKSSKKKRNPNRAPSGFVKPALISDELAGFLNKPIGTEMARTSVTKEINNYIKEKSLADKENGRHIIPDEALTKLLNLSPTDTLTYFNLQKYMRHHFPKPEQATSAVSSEV